MKKHFEEYNDICYQIREYQYKLETLKTRLYSIAGISYSDIPKSRGNGADIDYQIQEIEEVEKEIEVLKMKKHDKYLLHLRQIQKCIKDERKRSVIRSYYLLKLNIQEIADSLEISYNHVLRLKKEAENEFLENMR